MKNLFDLENVTGPGLPIVSAAQLTMVLSLFPGADLLGRGFEQEGFCVVRGPDRAWGGDVRTFHAVPEVFSGVIGGPPCPDFSDARRTEPTGEGLELLGEFLRVVDEAKPDWFLMENTRRVPTVSLFGYTIQRFNLTAAECGLKQRRLRSFQFGFRDGASLVIPRATRPVEALQPCCLASEGRRKHRRGFPDFCELMGLPRDFDLPGLSLGAKYRAVGNGVPVAMGSVIARAIKSRFLTLGVHVCECNCGRPVTGRQRLATAACRKRVQRRRDAAGIDSRHMVTPELW